MFPPHLWIHPTTDHVALQYLLLKNTLVQVDCAIQTHNVQGSTVVAPISAHHRIFSFAFGNLENWISSTSCPLTSMGLGKSLSSLATVALWESSSWTEGQAPTTMWWIIRRKCGGTLAVGQAEDSAELFLSWTEEEMCCQRDSGNAGIWWEQGKCFHQAQ